MKKLIIILFLCGWALNLHALPPFFSYGGGTVSGEVNVSDDAYNATTWNNDGLNAPSRNAVRDKFESLSNSYQAKDTDHDSIAAGITGILLGLGNGSGYQALQLNSSLALTGTTLGLNTTLDLSAFTITFGLEASDIPDLSGTYQPLDTDLTTFAAISGQRGDVLYYGASGWTRLGKGTLGYVLTQGENDPAWAAATGGSFSGDSSDVDYDNTESDLEATDVQGAIDEVVGMIGAIEVGEANLASPGPIGGTTPNTGAFTTITVDEIAISKKPGEPSYYFLYEAETVSNMGVGAIGPDNVASTYYVKEPDALPAGSIAVYGTPAEESVPNLGTVAVSDKAWLDVTTSIDEESTNTEIPTAAAVESRIDSKIAGIEIPEGSGLPEGGTLNQIIVMTSEGAAWMDFDDHPAYTTLLNAFTAAGLNTFTFTPHEFGLNSTGYVSSVPFPVSFEIIPSSETYAVDSAEWKIDSGEYASMSYNGGSGYWEATGLTGAEGSHTLTLKATDDKPTTPNSGEEEFTFVVDTTDPVINLSAGSNPTTHDGSGADTWDLQIGMIEELHTALIQYRLTVDGGTTPDWSTWASPWTTTGIPLPEETEDLHIAVKVTDLAGNWDTSGITVGYAGNVCTEDCGDFLVCQNFEGTGYDNSETWTESVPEGGTVDEDDTTSPVMSGSQQLLITGGTSAVSSTTVSFGEQTEVWGHVLMKTPDATPDFDIELFRLGNAATAQRAIVYLRTSGILRASVAGANGDSTGTLSDNTAYRIWYHYRASTGSDGVWDIWVSDAATLTRPASPWCTISTHTGTSNVWTFMHRIPSGYTIRSDKILIDNAEFTTVCE